MVTFSAPVLIFIILNFFSLVLISFQIYLILKQKAYFTKWTLFQICLCIFFEHLVYLPLPIIYGDDMRRRALETPFCIIFQKIDSFFFYQMQILPSLLSFYFWYVLVKNETSIEARTIWWVSSVL